jgi:molybdopterin-guanine dinucleotide biosynthesis protein A
MIFHGFVQAGGGSTRFGTDKALVQLDGKTMLQRTGELLTAVCGDVKIVAPAAKYQGAPWPTVSDRWPGEGPLGGILTGLMTMQRSESNRVWTMHVSCDMPFLTTEFLMYLRERASRSAAQVVVPHTVNGLEPLCACWRADSVAALEAVFASGVRKVTEAMKRLTMEVLDDSAWKRFDTDNRLFSNMNTPADYEEARRALKAHKE